MPHSIFSTILNLNPFKRTDGSDGKHLIQSPSLTVKVSAKNKLNSKDGPLPLSTILANSVC